MKTLQNFCKNTKNFIKIPFKQLKKVLHLREDPLINDKMMLYQRIVSKDLHCIFTSRPYNITSVAFINCYKF